MASLATSGWIPEDDLLLMNSIEAGASLEALAKGAVRFSRRFTVRELRDRWHSLLYDPVVSAEASARLAEFETSGNNNLYTKSNRILHSLGNGRVGNKRKIESVRNLYYASRKKTCNGARNSNGNDCIGSGDGCQTGLLGGFVAEHFVLEDVGLEGVNDATLDDNLQRTPGEDRFREFSTKGKLLSFKELGGLENFEKNGADEGPLNVLTNSTVRNGSIVEGMESCHAMPETGVSFSSLGYSSPLPAVPLWKTMEDIPAPVMPMSDSPSDKGQGTGNNIVQHDAIADGKIAYSSRYAVHSEVILKERQIAYEMNSSGVIPGTDFAALRDEDPLSDYVDEHERLLMDAGGVATMDKSCYDSVSSLLLNSPNDVHEDDMSKTKDPHTLDSFYHVHNDVCSTELDIIPDQQLPSGHDEQKIFSPPEVNVPSCSSMNQSHSADSHDQVICCTLNTEDPEIPCNDDILFSVTQRTGTIHLASPFSVHKDRKQELGFTKNEDGITHNFTAQKLGREDVFPENTQDAGSKLHDCQNRMISRQIFNDHVDPCLSRPNHGIPNIGMDCSLKEGSLHTCNTKHVSLSAETIVAADPAVELEVEPSTSDVLEYESEDEDDIPTFSDIEAMILEMDLCPDDSDSCITKEVSRYQREDTKRMIIRLEQCAQSAMQRAIASRGAFAVLYGRRMKHYIKETEVTLGRATEEIDVDIDLGKEGHANKISRRQALIKIQGDGSFILKNIGKSPVFLNGKEVATGQLMNLRTSSLIEIRDMAFVFEINHKAVRNYVTRMIKEPEQNTKLEWSEESL